MPQSLRAEYYKVVEGPVTTYHGDHSTTVRLRMRVWESYGLFRNLKAPDYASSELVKEQECCVFMICERPNSNATKERAIRDVKRDKTDTRMSHR